LIDSQNLDFISKADKYHAQANKMMQHKVYKLMSKVTYRLSLEKELNTKELLEVICGVYIKKMQAKEHNLPENKLKFAEFMYHCMHTKY
jgi:hypothetical protein